jgi:cardiolipin synthase A/B
MSLPLNPTVHPSGHSLVLLQGSTEYFPALVAAMEQARFEIRFETYLFHVEGAGVSVAQALEQAALRGVQVMVVLDGAGSKDMDARWLERWTRAGVHWRIFEPIGTGGLWFPTRWRRLHRKLCVVDRQHAFCGGINVLDDAYDPHHKAFLQHPRLDYAVELGGPEVAEIHASMVQLWVRLEISKNLRARRLGAALDVWREGEVQPWRSSTGPVHWVQRDNLTHRQDIQRSYLKAIGRAKKEILIANAFFLPDHKIRRALQTAARRGVKVSLLLPGHYEFAVPYRASRVVYGQLMGAGVDIFEYHLSYLHAKVAVIDQHWSTVGSSNLDPLSLLLAREANLVIEDAGFATQLKSHLNLAMTQGAHAVLPGIGRQPWWDRWLDKLSYAVMRALVFLTSRSY